MPVFENQLAKRLYSSRFHSSVKVENEVINGENVVVFRSNRPLPELHDQVIDYFANHIEIVSDEISDTETIVKFRFLK